ncbi:hypothetical protein [Paenibacillus sp.]|uniref:hypothetical protein n=1 Tax=Paenibacillus sp. TaxID=58172 RepID=UPI002D686488|nr:hypothetical protein [Paenibacillus sp.]HZG85031.1 hypothetical protein [Paenibacillus sp.]
MKTETVYIVLTDTGTRFSRVIKRITGAPYNHASLALCEGLDPLFSFGRKDKRLPWLAGFVRESRSDGHLAAGGRTRCAVYALPVDAGRRARIAAELERFEREADRYGFNYLGLLNFLAPLHIKTPNAYFCSEFVAEMLRRGGVEPVGKPPSETAPHDFMSAEPLRLVYEGPLAAYRP